jgi:hypothetical protein
LRQYQASPVGIAGARADADAGQDHGATANAGAVLDPGWQTGVSGIPAFGVLVIGEGDVGADVGALQIGRGVNLNAIIPALFQRSMTTEDFDERDFAHRLSDAMFRSHSAQYAAQAIDAD